MDRLTADLPAYFESSQIHIAGLVVATYAGENYSHYLASSSLGAWLKEQGVPAIYGVDTRSLTKKIRQQGSMLGRLLLQKKTSGLGSFANEVGALLKPSSDKSWRDQYEIVDWVDPNKKNLVADGMLKTT